MSGPVARSCVCGANRRLFNTALEFIKLVYQDSGSRAGRTRRVVAPRVDLLRLPVAHQMCIPDLRPGPVARTCGWELKVWITVDSATALVDEKSARPAAVVVPPNVHDVAHLVVQEQESCAMLLLLLFLQAVQRWSRLVTRLAFMSSREAVRGARSERCCPQG